MQNLRIVSLLPAATEMMMALGYEQNLVGRSHACDYPESVKELPVCTSENGLNTNILTELKPDLVLSQTEVQGIKTLCLDPEDMGDVWTDIRNIAKAMGDEEKGHHLVFKLQQRQASVAAGALDSPPRVVCIEGIEPLTAAGKWMPELVEMASGDNLMGTMGENSPTISWEELKETAPEMLILMPRDYSIEQTHAEMKHLTENPVWETLPAVKKNQVYIANAQQYFSRPGPRLVEALEILGEILHPETFNFGHEGAGWVKWQSR